MGQHCVLEVDHADPRGAGPFRQPEQVLGVEVAVGEDRRPSLASLGDVRPQTVPFGEGRGPQIEGRGQPGLPVDEQVRPGLERHSVIGQQRPRQTIDGQDAWRRELVKSRLGVHGREVELGLVLSLFHQPGEDSLAEVFDHGQALADIEGLDPGRREAARAQVGGGGGEGVDPPGGQARHRVPTGRLALRLRPCRIAGRAFGRGRLVHQHQGRA